MPYINQKTGKEIKKGDEVVLRDGKATITDVESADGLIYVLYENGITTGGYYPSVFDARWSDVVTNMNEEQIEAIRTARTQLESLNTQVHRGAPILGNGRILKAMEVLDVAFQDELGIGQ